MRICIIFIAACIIGFSTRGEAQIAVPNGGFEQWDSIPSFPAFGFLPEGWLNLNSAASTSTIFQSTDSHSGSFALGGRVLSVGDSIVSPQIETCMWPSEGKGLTFGFPIAGSPTALTGWLKLNSVDNDVVRIHMIFGHGVIAIYNDSVSHDYQQFILPLPPTDSGRGSIEITVENAIQLDTQKIPHAGTEFELDDVALTYSSSVHFNDGVTFGLATNYPNPFYSSTTIGYSLPEEDNVTLEVLNMLGECVSLLEEGEESQGEHQVFFNGNGFASGPYVCRLITASQGVSSQIIQLSH